MGYILMFLIGMIVGWNFLPQPTFVATLVAKVVAFVKGLFTKKTDTTPPADTGGSSNTAGTTTS